MAEEPSPLSRQLYRLAGDLARLTDKVETLTTAADDVAALRRRVHSLPPGDDLKAVLGDLGGTLKDITARLETLESAVTGPADRPQVWNWAAMNEDETAAAWATLTQWVGQILIGVYDVIAPEDGDRLRKKDRPAKIPACWTAHKDLVWELSWLCQEWTRIYTTADGRPAAAGDWHDRYLLGLRRRLEDTTAGHCLANGHAAAGRASGRELEYDRRQYGGTLR